MQRLWQQLHSHWQFRRRHYCCLWDKPPLHSKPVTLFPCHWGSPRWGNAMPLTNKRSSSWSIRINGSRTLTLTLTMLKPFESQTLNFPTNSLKWKGKSWHDGRLSNLQRTKNIMNSQKLKLKVRHIVVIFLSYVILKLEFQSTISFLLLFCYLLHFIINYI